MYLFNHTPIPVAIVPNEQEGNIVALLVLAATYTIERDRLLVAEEQRPLLLVCPPPEIGDGYITKVGTSVCATGYAYAREPGARMGVAHLCVGDFEQGIAVFGERVWREGLGGALVPSDPSPFERVAMTWQNAYGGSIFRKTARHKAKDGTEGILPEHHEAFPFNIEGTGYYPDRSFAVGKPLPQLEDPAALIQHFSDQPEPVCFAPYPMHGGLRAKEALTDGKVDFTRHGDVLSRAAPRTTFGEIAPGTRIALSGMRPGGEVLAFDVPPPPVVADVSVGRRGRRLDLYVDAIDIDAEARQARIVYRAVFAYELIAEEIRVTKVQATPQFAAMVLAGKG